MKIQIGSDNYVRTTDIRFISTDAVPSSLVSATAKLLLESTRAQIGDSISLTVKDAATGQYHGSFSSTTCSATNLAPSGTPVDVIVQVTITALDAGSVSRTTVEEVTVTPSWS